MDNKTFNIHDHILVTYLVTKNKKYTMKIDEDSMPKRVIFIFEDYDECVELRKQYMTEDRSFKTIFDTNKAIKSDIHSYIKAFSE